MTIKEVKQEWIKEINEMLAKFDIVVKDTSSMKVYDATKERGMSRKLWLCADCVNGDQRYFYMYISKKNELKKYNGTVFDNGRSAFEEDIKNYKYLGRVS